MRNPLQQRRFAPVLFLALVLSAVTEPVAAGVPATVGLEGRLQTQAGGPVADGVYEVTFALYGAEKGGQASWQESAKLKVAGGRFAWGLGAVTPLSAAALDGSKAAWLGVSVGKDPELPRAPLRAVAFAKRAALADSASAALVAADLKCSACVSASELKFDGDLDLGGYSIKAKKVTVDSVLAKTVAATSFIGDGAQLTGVKVSGGACKSGEVVTEVKPDGTVVCTAGGGAGAMLGGKVSDTFTEQAKVGALPLSIPDNTGASATVQATYGKVGTANSLSVKVELSNTDLSKVQAKLFPPSDKKVGWTLCDPCGDPNAKSLNKTYTPATALKSGSLKDALGKSLEGIWTLKVLDSAFCLPQLPGNAALCDPVNKLDGAVKAFAVSATVTSAQSVKFGATLQLVMLAAPPFDCEPAKKAHVFYDTKLNKLRFCDGQVWRSLSDTCGNGILEKGEQCDDGNNSDGDGCSSTCTTVCGDKLVVGLEECDDGNKVDGDGCSKTCVAGRGASKSDPILSCHSLKKAVASSKDGVYWMSAGGKLFQTWCDMTTDGGGWTLVATVHEDNIGAKCNAEDRWSSTSGNASSKAKGDGNWENTTTFGGVTSATKSDYKNPAYAAMAAKDVMLYHTPNGTADTGYRSAALLRYHTSNGFLSKYGGTLRSLYKDHFPVGYGGSCGQKGPAIPVKWDKGSNSAIDSYIAPNAAGESTPGYIHFRVFNNEKACNALCPGIRYDGCNTEHACIGGGGWFPEGSPKQCGDFSAWDWDGYGTKQSWSASKALTESTVMIFTR